MSAKLKISLLLLILPIILIVNINSAYAVPEFKAKISNQQQDFNGYAEKTLNIISNPQSGWNLYVQATDPYLVCSLKQIPIARVSISDNGKTYKLESNRPILIDSGSTGQLIKDYSIKIETSKADTPGTYSGNLRFILTSQSRTYTADALLSYQQPVIQELTVSPKTININITGNNALQKGYGQISESPNRIYVRSNTDWKLILDKKVDKNKLEYQFMVSDPSPNLVTYFNNNYTKLSEGQVIIAEGKYLPTPDGKDLEPQLIEINYKVKTPDNKIQQAGTYSCDVIYNLIAK